MKTIGVKLSDEQAEAITVAAARRGMTVSAAVWALLRQATADFMDFSMLDEEGGKCVRGAHTFLAVSAMLCAVDGCGQPATGEHHYCKLHQMRYQRHGDPAIVQKRGRKRSQEASRSS